MFQVTKLEAVKAAFAAITSPTGGGGSVNQKLFALVQNDPIQAVTLKSYVCSGLPTSRIESRVGADDKTYTIASEKMQCTGTAEILVGNIPYTCKMHLKVALQLNAGPAQCKFQVSTADARIQWISVSCINPMSDTFLYNQ